MRTFVRFAGYAFIVVLLLLAVAITFTVGWRPIIGPRKRQVTSRQFQATPERLKRGEYLVEHVSLCYGCHTTFDAKDKDMPQLLAAKGSGRVMVDQGGFRVVAPNITPDLETGIGKWTDDELARAIREGIARDGRALFPIMPYHSFSHMADEDLASIIVYLRSQPPAHNNPGTTHIPFPVSRLINSAPQPVGTVAAPDPSNAVAYGKYLVTAVGVCGDCHTPRDQHGQSIAGMYLAGGNIFDESGKAVASANITPDPSGISYYDETMFVRVMRTGSVKGRKLNVMMPTWAFDGMTDQDLKDIYAYLRSIPPAHHRIDNTEKPSLCKIDGQMHGMGAMN
ncbi:MAG TPA: c-type cytochrome [Terriglobales bacterium]|nr:c-type cytochrome [Terriglobales bacterium]